MELRWAEVNMDTLVLLVLSNLISIMLIINSARWKQTDLNTDIVVDKAVCNEYVRHSWSLLPENVFNYQEMCVTDKDSDRLNQPFILSEREFDQMLSRTFIFTQSVDMRTI